MQSVELSCARYMFYRDNGKVIDMDNYEILFMNQKSFIKKHGKSNKELRDEYGYEEFKRGIINGNVVLSRN